MIIAFQGQRPIVFAGLTSGIAGIVMHGSSAVILSRICSPLPAQVSWIKKALHSVYLYCTAAFSLSVLYHFFKNYRNKEIYFDRLDLQENGKSQLEKKRRAQNSTDVEPMSILVYSCNQKPISFLKEYFPINDFPNKRLTIWHCGIEKIYQTMAQIHYKNRSIVYMFIDIDKKQQAIFKEKMAMQITFDELCEFAEKYDSKQAERTSQSLIYLVRLASTKDTIEAPINPYDVYKKSFHSRQNN